MFRKATFSTHMEFVFDKKISTPKDVELFNLELRDQITVEAFVESTAYRAEAIQPLISKWKISPDFTNFAAFDAGNIDGLVTKAYFGAVFDGRYIYFSPQQIATDKYNGVVLKFDTHGAFKDPASYSAYDAGGTGGISTKGFYGAVFDGIYVYFVPRQNEFGYHTNMLRYDTRKDFKDSKSWQSHDAGFKNSKQGAAFDGRYIYFAPGFSGDTHAEDHPSGNMIKFDTQGDLHDPGSYQAFDINGLFSGLETTCYDGAVFDGKYIYFSPIFGNVSVRYDTQGRFNDRKSWEAFDGNKIGMGQCVGLIFDGRYIYFAAYGQGNIVRFDTQGGFTNVEAWQSFNTKAVHGVIYVGYDGCFFDGKYVYFVPFICNVPAGTPNCHVSRGKSLAFHGDFVRYDCTKDFSDPHSWQFFDSSKVDGLKSFGYNAGAFDGRYFYCAPWQHGKGYEIGKKHINIHGNILRYDTTGSNASFSLRYCDCGTNGGLNAALRGPTFLINTQNNVFSVSTKEILKPGFHYIAGVYDSKSIKLYVDGKMIAQASATGKINKSNANIALGKLQEGASSFSGVISFAAISNIAKDASDLQMRWENLSKR